MRRTRPPLLLRHSPLVLVLAQVRISPVLQMKTYVPAIQERLRKAGYPRFAETQIQEIVLFPGPGGTPAVNTQSKWLFHDRENKSAVVVSPDFIALETVAYDTFDAFSARLVDVLEVVREVAQVELAERLGLRYVDHIRPLGSDRLDDYLNAGVVGLGDIQGATAAEARFLATGTSDFGQFVFRLSRSAGKFALPPDLQPQDLQPDVSQESGDHAVLDVDHFSVAPREFSPGALIDGLWDLHDVVEGLFRTATTPHAMRMWGAEEREGVNA